VDVSGEKTVTDAQFDERIAAIQTKASELQDRADAYRDQELARLFLECEWTQERIGQKMGRTQAWVSFRLIFGRFLSFITSGYKDQTESLLRLTERAFRKVHARTRGTERERFAEVLARLNVEKLPLRQRNLIKKPGYCPAIVALMEEGKWFTIQQLLDALRDRFPEIDLAAISNGVSGILRKPPAGKTVQVKKIGKRCRYRLRKHTAAGEAFTPDAVEGIAEAILPIIEELKHWGNAHEYEQSPVAIKRLAAQLERAIAPLVQGVPH